MLESLSHFLLVVRHGTFALAARHAHLSAPAFTASMQRLEADVGAPLFARGRRGATLTAAGEALLPHAQNALAAVDAGRRALRALDGLEIGEVRIGAGTIACTYLLPPYVARFRRRHPTIRFVLRELAPHAVRAALDAREIDLGIGDLGEGERWIRDELVLVGAPDSPRAREVSRAAFVTFPRGSSTRALVDRYFPDADVVMELSSVAAVKANVRAGVGVSLLSRAAVERDLRSRRLRRVSTSHVPAAITRDVTVAHRGLTTLSPAARAFRELLLSAERVR